MSKYKRQEKEVEKWKESVREIYTECPEKRNILLESARQEERVVAIRGSEEGHEGTAEGEQ